MKFVECDTCRAKPGSPVLCSGCLNNRAYITELEAENLKFCERTCDAENCLSDMKAKVEQLEAALFDADAWKKPPCIICGYNGPGYYQPDTHPCARRVVQALGEKDE